MDLSTSQVETNQVSDEQPSCPQNIVTPEHSYWKSPEYTSHQCNEDIKNEIQEETQSNINENMEQDSTIDEYDEYVNEATEHCENPNERNEEFEPPVPLIKSGKPLHICLMI